MTKIFCLGLPKTCTTSLRDFFLDEGYKATGSLRKLKLWFRRGDYEKIFAFYEENDFFKDPPTPFLYKLIFERYGTNAKYILTLRKDPQTWLGSYLRHEELKSVRRFGNKTLCGRMYPHGFEQDHIDYYEAFNRDVVAFFEEKGASDSLLILKPEVDDCVPKLEAFLGRSFTAREFPRANESAKRNQFRFRLRRLYNGVIQPAYGKYGPRLLPRVAKPAAVIEPK